MAYSFGAGECGSADTTMPRAVTVFAAEHDVSVLKLLVVAEFVDQLKLHVISTPAGGAKASAADEEPAGATTAGGSAS